MVCLFYSYFLAVQFYTARMPVFACRQNGYGARFRRFLVEEFKWKVVLESYMWLCKACVSLLKKNTWVKVKLHDLRIQPRCEWDLHCWDVTQPRVVIIYRCFRTGPITLVNNCLRCYEMSVCKYQSTLRNIPEDRKSQSYPYARC